MSPITATVLLSLVLAAGPSWAADEVASDPVPAARPAPLVGALRAGDGDEVARLLAAGADPLERDAEGRTTYDWMMTHGHYPSAFHLLLHAAQAADLTPAAGVGALGLSVVRGDSLSVFHLLRAGVAVDAVGPSGYTALSLALRFGRESEVIRLLGAGADPRARNADPLRTTPLHLTARDGRVAFARRLLAAGARVDEPDAVGDTALIWATRAGHAPFVAALIERRTDLGHVGRDGETALDIAVRDGHAGLIALLRASGAPSARDGLR